MNIQWFPGHMTKARRMMAENVKLVDAVCEIADARIPVSSRNPDLDDICGARPRLLILNRIDQADPELTEEWLRFFRQRHVAVLPTDCRTGKGTRGFSTAVKQVLEDRIRSLEEKGQTGRCLRVMIVGIPNVGKSSFINRVANRKAAQTSDRPGVTRGKQWIRVNDGLELLDTPGVLWPRFENRIVGEHLAYTGAIRDQILDGVSLAGNLLLLLRDRYPDRVRERYRIDPGDSDSGFELLEKAGRKRGCLVSGGQVDLERIAAVVLDEFRGGKLGLITLETPCDMAEDGSHEG
ncbi:MAG: ribosome biogenesis GTPase YlqF [Oscillospiraceae bacterium]|nr:ribosome biogenesis GTPase YlqF [Oscillospiraceae bacterium]